MKKSREAPAKKKIKAKADKDFFKDTDVVKYNGSRNLDRVMCYTWERKRGGPSGEFEEAASAVV